MKKSGYWMIVVLVLGALVLSACGGGGAESDGGEGNGEGVTVPAEYAGRTNPLADDQAAADAGQQIYAQNCASCHGESGQGNGPAGESLDPPPSDLTQTVSAREDDYIFWRIAEGGQMEPFNSAMPAWKGVLTEDQIWQVVTYMHTWE